MAAHQGAPRVHLFTLDHGYGYLFNQWSRRSARSLGRAIGPDRVLHRFLHTRDLLDELAMHSLLDDRRRYGEWFGCCLGCTMAMVTKVLIYNLERAVPHVMLGSSVGGQYAVMSMPVTIELQKAFMARYGVLYSAPLVEEGIVKDVERRMLAEAGIDTGVRFLDKHSFGNQGYCLLSLQHLPDVLINWHPVFDPGAVRQFFVDKLPRCEAYIATHFRRTNRDLDAAIGRLRAVTGPHLHEAGSG
jgi:hypothetical protein